MKKLVCILLVSAGFLMYKPVTAQVNVNINIGAQPVWGPVGYDYVDYYYLPDIEAYYYVPTHQFIYLTNGKWIFATTLPVRYRAYNIYTGYKVVLNQPRPYLRFASHRVVYAKYKGNNGKQGIIKNSNNPKYYVVRGHPKHKAAGNKTIITGSKAHKSGKVTKGNGQGSVAKGKGNGNGKGKN